MRKDQSPRLGTCASWTTEVVDVNDSSKLAFVCPVMVVVVQTWHSVHHKLEWPA